ncbi:VOC family protein [Aeromonas taiwanensis]|uniref:VOC family protein n=1 Tax=Aeromonas taiwanensis TaxID=633417 RepID=UPI00207D5058|nr:VOC family protein [Aeromonas taiwanensis]MCO4204665.1 VOC family protein [Aeromonas taiwanensis]
MVTMSHPLDSTLGPMAPFVCQLLTEMHTVMGASDSPVVDHLCYRAATLPEYLELKETLAAHGVLLVEGMIGGRPIATYRLHRPVSWQQVTVPCIELAAPKAGRNHQAGLEHIELVVPSLQALVAAHPDVAFKTANMDDVRNPDVGLMLPSGQIKFHLRPLSEVIDEELCTGAVVPVPADYYDGL